MTIRHSKALYALAALTLVAAGVSALRGSTVGVVVSVGLGVVLLFVLGTAWARFRGEPAEHHARSDKILDDTDP